MSENLSPLRPFKSIEDAKAFANEWKEQNRSIIAKIVQPLKQQPLKQKQPETTMPEDLKEQNLKKLLEKLSPLVKPIPPTPVWVSVDERLPEFGTRKVWANRDTPTGVRNFVADMVYSETWNSWMQDGSMVPHFVRVTHWLDFQ